MLELLRKRKTILCLIRCQSYLPMEMCLWRRSPLRFILAWTLSSLVPMAAESLLFSVSWVACGHWQEACSEDLTWISYSIFHNAPIFPLALSETKSYILTLASASHTPTRKLDNCWNGLDWTTSKRDKRGSILWMIGTMCYQEVRNSVLLWQDCSIIVLFSPFWMNAHQQWVWTCRQSCTWKQRS